MKFNIDLATFSKIIPSNKNAKVWYDVIMDVLPQYDIDTELRFSMFMAQCCHESNNFTVLVENLNYSADGLLKTFPTHFSKNEATQYARKPEKIANRVYANRMGNGDEDSGDGWKYKGTGVIQLTGKSNFTLLSADMYPDEPDYLLKYPEQLLIPENAVIAACWFWDTNDLNSYADKQDIKGVTKKINGGNNGILERSKIYNDILDILGV
jgi:putative chitinase